MQPCTAFETVKHRPATEPIHPTTYKRTHIHTDSPGACVCARCPRSGSGWLAFLQRCRHLCHLLHHLLRRGAVQELARARVEQVLLEPRCIQPSILWQCRQLYSTVVLPSCCVSFLSKSAFTQLLLTFLPPLFLYPPTTRPVGGGACSSWPGRAKLD